VGGGPIVYSVGGHRAERSPLLDCGRVPYGRGWRWGMCERIRNGTERWSIHKGCGMTGRGHRMYVGAGTGQRLDNLPWSQPGGACPRHILDSINTRSDLLKIERSLRKSTSSSSGLPRSGYDCFNHPAGGKSVHI